MADIDLDAHNILVSEPKAHRVLHAWRGGPTAGTTAGFGFGRRRWARDRSSAILSGRVAASSEHRRGKVHSNGIITKRLRRRTLGRDARANSIQARAGCTVPEQCDGGGLNGRVSQMREGGERAVCDGGLGDQSTITALRQSVPTVRSRPTMTTTASASDPSRRSQRSWADGTGQCYRDNARTGIRSASDWPLQGRLP